MISRRKAGGAIVGGALAIVIAIALISLSLGTTKLSFMEVLATLAGRGEVDSSMIVLQLRLPRILAAIMVGAALGVAGALLQGVVRNPLASPDVLGVTGGASVCVVAFMTLVKGFSVHWIPFVAAAGALAAAALLYGLGWKKGISPSRLVIIGIGLSAAAGALTTFLLISGPSYLATQVLSWTTGSIYGTNWTYIKMLWPWIVILLPCAMLLFRELNVQSLGAPAAIGLGSSLQRSRLLALLICVALCGAAVGVAGTLSFIGLMAPHLSRLLVGASYRLVLPMSALTGAALLLLADLGGRMLFMPLDIPAGVFTAGVGAPFFIFLLFKTRQSSISAP